MADSYRRLRNTARFLLGNLDGFDPGRHAVAPKDMLPLDRWALAQAVRLMNTARRVYGEEAGGAIAFGADTYGYQVLVQELMRFCSVDLGSEYLDMTKDRLYTLPEDHPSRRSAQSAMYAILEILVRAFAPILSFTADEIWSYLPARPQGQDSALFATWQDLASLHDFALGAEEADRFARLRELRTSTSKQIEVLRNAGGIGGSVEADVTLAVDARTHAQLAPCADELRFYFISSNVVLDRVADDATAPSFVTSVKKSEHAKCVRCWQHRADVGTHAAHPELCGRCVGNIGDEPEARRWF